MARRSRQTMRASEIADSVLRSADPHGRRFGARAVSAWHEVVGDVVSHHTSGVALREGALVVTVDSAAWATELALMADDFRSALNSRLGQDLVRSIRFTVSRRVESERERARAVQEVEAHYVPDATPPAPLSDVEIAQADYVSQSVADERLRQSALRAMIKDLEWKKAARKGTADR